jgi:hypothetical protein
MPFHMMPGLIGLAMAVFWFVLLIDCFRNPWLSGRSKLLWVLLLFFTSWIGMLLYFLLACSFSPIVQKRRAINAHPWPPGVPPTQTYRPYYPPYQQPYEPYQPPVAPISPDAQPYAASYRPYQEGYQAQVRPQDRPKTVQFAQDLPIGEEASDEPQSEQPQATYPLMPPQEQ